MCVWGLGLYYVVCVCVCVQIFFSTQSSEGLRQKCSTLIVCDFVKTLEGILPLNHRDRETHKEWVGCEQEQEGDEILIAMLCIHLNLSVFKDVNKGWRKMFAAGNRRPKTQNGQNILKPHNVSATRDRCGCLRSFYDLFLFWSFHLQFLFWLLWHSTPQMKCRDSS